MIIALVNVPRSGYCNFTGCTERARQLPLPGGGCYITHHHIASHQPSHHPIASHRITSHHITSHHVLARAIRRCSAASQAPENQCGGASPRRTRQASCPCGGRMDQRFHMPQITNDSLSPCIIISRTMCHIPYAIYHELYTM